MDSDTDLPTTLTIDEAAGVLRGQLRADGVRARPAVARAATPNGLPVVRVGRSLRVPGHVGPTGARRAGRERGSAVPGVKRAVIRTRTHRAAYSSPAACSPLMISAAWRSRWGTKCE